VDGAGIDALRERENDTKCGCGEPIDSAIMQNRRGSTRSFSVKESHMLWGLIVVLVVLWLLGFLVVHVAGPLIHLLLVIAVIVLIYQLVTGRTSL
jgi:hypothetical protein